jgi:hypothetical protein
MAPRSSGRLFVNSWTSPRWTMYTLMTSSRPSDVSRKSVCQAPHAANMVPLALARRQRRVADRSSHVEEQGVQTGLRQERIGTGRSDEIVRRRRPPALLWWWEIDDRERGHLLRHSILEEGELVAGHAAYERSGTVRDRHVHLDVCRPGAEGKLVAGGRPLSRQGDRRQQEAGNEDAIRGPRAATSHDRHSGRRGGKDSVQDGPASPARQSARAQARVAPALQCVFAWRAGPQLLWLSPSGVRPVHTIL